MRDAITTGRPYTPRPSLRIDGEPVPHLTAAMTELTIIHSTQGIARCLLRLKNRGIDIDEEDGEPGPLLEPDADDFGRVLSVHTADGDPLFTGRVYALGVELESHRLPVLILRAEGLFGRMQQAARTRQFQRMSIPDVLSTVFNEHGVEMRMDIRDSLPLHPVIRQQNEDDFSFVRGLAARIHADLWQEDGRVRIVQRTAWPIEPALTLTYDSTLHQFSARADLSEQQAGVTVHGKDDERTFSATAEDIHDELRRNRGRSGPDLLRERFDESAAVVYDSTVQDESEAAVVAQTLLDRRAQRFVTANGSTGGSAALHPGVVVDIWQVGAPFDGKYCVVTVRHRFTPETGFTTEFELERADLFTALAKQPTLRDRLTAGLPFDHLRDSRS